MTAKIKRAELSNLQRKYAIYNMTPDPTRRRLLWAAMQSYAKIILRRHGVNEQTHTVDIQTGIIIEKEIGESKVQAEIEQHL